MFRMESLAYELSNDDYSADLAGAINDSSFSNDCFKHEKHQNSKKKDCPSGENSSLKSYEDNLNRKQSTMTFNPNYQENKKEQNRMKNDESFKHQHSSIEKKQQIVQKRRKRKNQRHRKQTNPVQMLKDDDKNSLIDQKDRSEFLKQRNMFRSPQLTFQTRNASKSYNLTPQIKQFELTRNNPNISHFKRDTNQNEQYNESSDRHYSSSRLRSNSKLDVYNDDLKDELEEEFKQYLDFSEFQNQFQNTQNQGFVLNTLPNLLNSPSKQDDQMKIFSKHNRFSMHPKKVDSDKNLYSDQRKTSLDSQGKRFEHKRREHKQEEKDNQQSKKYHKKYKFETHKNQLKKVPLAPVLSNAFYMQNQNKPIHYHNTPNMRSSYHSTHRDQSQLVDKIQSQQTQNQTFSNIIGQQQFKGGIGLAFESPYGLRDYSYNDLGASMTMIVASDSFLNDDQGIDLGSGQGLEEDFNLIQNKIQLDNTGVQNMIQTHLEQQVPSNSDYPGQTQQEHQIPTKQVNEFQDGNLFNQIFRDDQLDNHEIQPYFPNMTINNDQSHNNKCQQTQFQYQNGAAQNHQNPFNIGNCDEIILQQSHQKHQEHLQKLKSLERKRQILQEIDNQKKVIAKLLKDIREKDIIIREYQLQHGDKEVIHSQQVISQTILQLQQQVKREEENLPKQ
eukprot:403362184